MLMGQAILCLFRAAGHVLYPPSVCRNKYDSDGYCLARKAGYYGHESRHCLDCAVNWVSSIAAVIVAIIGGIVMLNQNGFRHETSVPILIWFGLWMGTWLFIHVGIPFLEWSEKGVPRILSWCILRLGRMLYPPLYVSEVMLAPGSQDGFCERHQQKECTPCGVDIFLDLMGSMTVMVAGFIVWEKYTVFSTPGLPFFVWICTACCMPIAWRLYARSLGRVTSAVRPALRRADTAPEQPAPRYISRRDVPPWEQSLPIPAWQEERQEEPIEGLPLPPEPVPEHLKPHAPLLERINATPPGEATPEKLEELAGLVTAFEQEQNGGRPVEPLREALTALEQMASVNHSP